MPELCRVEEQVSVGPGDAGDLAGDSGFGSQRATSQTQKIGIIGAFSSDSSPVEEIGFQIAPHWPMTFISGPKLVTMFA